MTKNNQPATVETVTGSGVCKCGTCGQIVGNMGKSHYKPGHDARHAGIIGRLVAETGDTALLEQLPSLPLQAKARKVAENAVAKAAKKNPKPETLDESADIEDEAFTVKVGRWSYPARNTHDGIERNTKTDGSGNWVAL